MSIEAGFFDVDKEMAWYKPGYHNAQPKKERVKRDRILLTPRSRAIIQTDAEGKETRYASIGQAVKRLRCCHKSIRAVADGITEKYKQYTFRYE